MKWRDLPQEKRYGPLYLIYQPPGVDTAFGYLLSGVPRKPNTILTYCREYVDALVFEKRHQAENCVKRYVDQHNHNVKIISSNDWVSICNSTLEKRRARGIHD